MELITLPQLVEAEQFELARIFSTPVVRKYLHIIGMGIVKNIAEGSPADGESPEMYIRKELHEKGKLAVVYTLLSIEAPPQSKE